VRRLACQDGDRGQQRVRAVDRIEPKQMGGRSRLLVLPSDTLSDASRSSSRSDCFRLEPSGSTTHPT
jgi:hypothetical protein